MPIEIATANDLDTIVRNSDNWGETFIQTADIDLSGYNWTPIGPEATSGWHGTYDGQDHKIKNLTITNQNRNYLGLFSSVGTSSPDNFQGIIKNVILENVNISIANEAQSSRVGGICGYGRNIKIENCHGTGTVYGMIHTAGGLLGDFVAGEGCVDSSFVGTVESTGDYNAETYGHYIGGMVGRGGFCTRCFTEGKVIGSFTVGGLCGQVDWFTTDCHSTADVTAGISVVGGLVGAFTYWSSYEVIRCYATGKVVAGDNRAGGFVGHATRMVIKECYSTGDVESPNSAGGFIARVTYLANFSDCYATGAVQGTNDVGGFVATGGDGLGGDNNFSRCYSTGAVQGTNDVGGFCGFIDNNLILSDCYYDSQTSGQSDDDGRGMPKTTSEMQNIDTYLPEWDIISGWEFEEEDPTVWFIYREYPLLHYQWYDAPYPTLVPILSLQQVGADIEVSWTYPEEGS